MLQYEELRLALLEQEAPLKELKEALGIDALKEEITSLDAETANEAFWNDVANSNKVLQKLAGLKNKVKKYEDLVADYDDTLTLIEMSNEEEDESMLEECTQGVEDVKAELEKHRHGKYNERQPFKLDDLRISDPVYRLDEEVEADMKYQKRHDHRGDVLNPRVTVGVISVGGL